MEDSRKEQISREYTAQFLGFLPSDLVNEISETCMELVTDGLEAVKGQVQKKLPGKFKQEELDSGFKIVGQKYHMNVEKIFEKLGSYVCAHILRVPNHVLLPEDSAWEEQDRVGVINKLAASNNEMTAIRNRIQNNIYRRAVLTAELEKVEQVCKVQEEMIVKDEQLFGKLDLENMKDITEFCLVSKQSQASKKKELEQARGGLARKRGMDCISSGAIKKKKVDERRKNCMETVEH